MVDRDLGNLPRVTVEDKAVYQSMSMRSYLDCLFEYHKPSAGDVVFHQEIRGAARDFAEVIYERCPVGGEFEKAIAHVRMAAMWANAAIACASCEEPAGRGGDDGD